MEDGSSSTVATVGWSSSDDADAVLDSVHSVFVSWSVSSREQTDRDVMVPFREKSWLCRFRSFTLLHQLWRDSRTFSETKDFLELGSHLQSVNEQAV
jgi:hypothetical protein